MYFISRIFQGLKVTIATAGLIGASLVLGYGIVAAKTVYIVGGSLCLIQSGILFFDSSKVLLDIKKQIGRLKNCIEEFRTENIQLQHNVHQLEIAKDQIISQTTRLEKSLQHGKEQLVKLEELKNKYQTLSEDLEINLNKEKESVATLENQTEVFKVQNKELEHRTEELIAVKGQLEYENSNLKNTVAVIREELIELEDLKTKYITENAKLQESVIEHRKQLEEFKTQNEVLDGSVKNFESENQHLHELIQKDEEQLAHLKNQVEKLKELYLRTDQLLQTLRTVGDTFTDFGTSIQTSAISLNETAGKMDATESGLNLALTNVKNLLFKLTGESFEKLDSNQDGIVTQEEFATNIEKL